MREQRQTAHGTVKSGPEVSDRATRPVRGPPTTPPRTVTATFAEPATITVGKSLDRSSAAQLLGDLDRQFKRRPQRLVLDLGEVATFDSAGGK